MEESNSKRKLNKCDIVLLLLTIFILFTNLIAIIYQLYGSEKGKIITTINILVLTVEFALFKYSKTNKGID